MRHEATAVGACGFVLEDGTALVMAMGVHDSVNIRQADNFIPGRFKALVMCATLLVVVGQTLLYRPSPALSSSTRCDLSLVLAIDISPSVDGHEYRLQMAGFANAFRDPDVVDAIRGVGGISVTMVQWSNVGNQRQVIGWTFVRNDDDARAFSHAITVIKPRKTWFGAATAIGQAVLFSAKLFETDPYQCRRRVVDVSGDGKNNIGPKPAGVRSAVAGIGITINGLAIKSDVDDLDRYYREEVIGGVGSFVIAAAGFADFAKAIRLKLLREIALRIAGRKRLQPAV